MLIYFNELAFRSETNSRFAPLRYDINSLFSRHRHISHYEVIYRAESISQISPEIYIAEFNRLIIKFIIAHNNKKIKLYVKKHYTFYENTKNTGQIENKNV